MRRSTQHQLLLSLETLEQRVTPVGELFVSEILFGPPGDPNTEQFLELRGAGGAAIAPGTYLAQVAGGPVEQRGEVSALFDLGGLVLGSNGHLALLQSGTPYSAPAGAMSLVAEGPGFTSGRFTAIEGRTALTGGTTTFALFRTDTPPALGDDIDPENTGTAGGSTFESWEILDSVGVLSADGPEEIAYGQVNFSPIEKGGAAGAITVATDFAPVYVARIGDSFDFTERDWFAAEVEGTAPDLAVVEGKAEPTEPPTFRLSHIGSANPGTPLDLPDRPADPEPPVSLEPPSEPETPAEQPEDDPEPPVVDDSPAPTPEPTPEPTPQPTPEAEPGVVQLFAVSRGPAVELYDAGGALVDRLLPFGDDAAEVRATVADVNGDGVLDVIASRGIGGDNIVTVISRPGGQVIAEVRAFEPGFRGGVFVAAGDLDGDGFADVVASPEQGGPRVTVFSGRDGSVLSDFFGIDDPAFTGGARTAVGDVNGDGVPDLIVSAGFGGGPRVAVYDGTSVTAGTPEKLVADFFAFDAATRLGVFIASGDLNGDGFAELIAGGPGVAAYDGTSLLNGDLARVADLPVGRADDVGARVVARDLNDDGRSDVVTASGTEVSWFFGETFDGTPTPTASESLSFAGEGDLATAYLG